MYIVYRSWFQSTDIWQQLIPETTGTTHQPQQEEATRITHSTVVQSVFREESNP